MPIKVESVIEISADTRTVFAFLANLENNPTWNWAVAETVSLDGAPRAGSRYLQTRSSPRKSKEMIKITSFDQGRLLEVTSQVDGTLVVYRYELFEIPVVGTRLLASVELQPFRKVGRPDLFAERLASVLAVNLEHLRNAIVERQESTRSGAA
jgi:hypothetical protein